MFDCKNIAGVAPGQDRTEIWIGLHLVCICTWAPPAQRVRIGSYNLFKLMNSIESKESRPGEASPGGGRGPDQSEQQHLQGVQVHQTT